MWTLQTVPVMTNCVYRKNILFYPYVINVRIQRYSLFFSSAIGLIYKYIYMYFGFYFSVLVKNGLIQINTPHNNNMIIHSEGISNGPIGEYNWIRMPKWTSECLYATSIHSELINPRKNVYTHMIAYLERLFFSCKLFVMFFIVGSIHYLSLYMQNNYMTLSCRFMRIHIYNAVIVIVQVIFGTLQSDRFTTFPVY